MAEAHETTRILADVGRGEPGAADRLLPLVYDDLRAAAEAQFRHQPAHQTLQPTALVHEAFMRLAQQAPDAWNNRTHFVAVASRAMRQILIDHARRRQAAKRGGGQQRMTLAQVESDGDKAVDLLALDEALDRLKEADERQARVVELRFFGGLSVKEVAEALDVSDRTVELDWKMAKAWLSRELSESDD